MLTVNRKEGKSVRLYRPAAATAVVVWKSGHCVECRRAGEQEFMEIEILENQERKAANGKNSHLRENHFQTHLPKYLQRFMFLYKVLEFLLKFPTHNL